MQDVFANPPASLGDVCDLYRIHKALAATNVACAVLDEAISFGSMATAGRIMACVPRDGLEQQTAGQLLQLLQKTLDEAQRVAIEAAHRLDRTRRSLDS